MGPLGLGDRNNGRMGRVYDEISESLGTFLEAQPVFFVATAPLDANGMMNCSPKGNRGEFVVLGPHRVAYLDQTGSGIETVAHLRENGRIVIMFCAFAGPPRIVRLHGRGQFAVPGTDLFDEIGPRFDGREGAGVRAIIAVDVTRVSDSCGNGVPFMAFESHRPTMDQWSTRKGPEGIREYQNEKNLVSLDGLAGLDATPPPR